VESVALVKARKTRLIPYPFCYPT